METFINENIDKCQPYITSDLSKLTNNNNMDSRITSEEIKQTITSFINNNTPGETNINMIIMKNIILEIF